MNRFYILLVLLAVSACNNVELKKEYYSNGRLKTETQYKNGKPNGISKEYSNGGRLLNRKNWKEGYIDTVDYYYQNGDIVKVIGDTNGKIQLVYFKENGNSNFKQLGSDGILVYAYSESDTITIGETYKMKVFLFMANQDSISNCKIVIGNADTNSGKIVQEVANFPASRLGSSEYSSKPNEIGKCTLFGVYQFQYANNKTIEVYPFKVGYYVKAK